MTILIQDNFTGGTDGDDINGRTPDTTNTPGNNWVANANTIELDGAGAAKWNSAGNVCRINAETADCRSIVEFNPGGNNNRCIVYCRLNNVAHGTGTSDCYEILFATNNNQVILYSRVNSSTTNIESISFTINSSTVYFIGVQARTTTSTMVRAMGGTSYPPPGIGSEHTNSAVDGSTVGGTYVGFRGDTRTDANGRFNTFYVDDDFDEGGGGDDSSLVILRRRIEGY